VSDRNPVVLLHGLGDTPKVMRRLAAYLNERGWQTHVPALFPSNGKADLVELAGQARAYIESTFSPGQTIDLVGFSMGGLVAQYYLQRLRGLDRVSRLVTISAPHGGTQTAFLLRRPGVLQMRPASSFLQDLGRDRHVLARIPFTSIWTPFDLMILPARSSVVAEAQCVRVRVATHWQMPRDWRVQRLVQEALQRR
jgi:triacylglycerol lipase